MGDALGTYWEAHTFRIDVRAQFAIHTVGFKSENGLMAGCAIVKGDGTEPGPGGGGRR